jgi:hypothetical protein
MVCVLADAIEALLQAHSKKSNNEEEEVVTKPVV